jgi:hypothetical protein
MDSDTTRTAQVAKFKILTQKSFAERAVCYMQQLMDSNLILGLIFA